MRRKVTSKTGIRRMFDEKCPTVARWFLGVDGGTIIFREVDGETMKIFLIIRMGVENREFD